MSKTDKFKLDYLTPYQLTSKDVLMDERRFKTIDNNLFALFRIFGNGVLVLESTEFPLYVEVPLGANAVRQVVVSPGRAFVNFKSVSYTTETIVSLPSQTGTSPSELFYLYLKDNDNTPQTEKGEFFFSSSRLASSANYIGLGAVQVDYTTGTTVFFDDSDSGREIINVKKLFLSFINSHAHTGGLGNPKKIDLANDTTGLIDPDSISIIDASKVTGGQLSEYVAPQVDHARLQGSGNLSHAQIDSAILSFRDSLNLEVVSSVNQLKLAARVVRTTTESTVFGATSAVYPSGSIANIDSDMTNVFVYVPNISSDGLVVGIAGSTGSNVYPNLFTNATGPSYVSTPVDRIAHMDRSQNRVIVNATGSGVPSSNVQKVFVLQDIDPASKILQAGQSGYFAGFVAGYDAQQSSGSVHMVHLPKGSTGSTGSVMENYETYALTLKERYNTMGVVGGEGLQVACLLTSLTDFAPTDLYIGGFRSHLLYSSATTGPRVLSPFHNGYLDSMSPVDFFLNTGPLGTVQSFYYESSTGPRVLVMSNGNVIVNMGSGNYTTSSLGNGEVSMHDAKIVLGEFSTSVAKITEIGPTGPVQSDTFQIGAENITNIAVSSFVSTSDFRVFHIDDDRLYVSDQNGSTQLGTFTEVVDIKVKYDRLWILTNEGGAQKVYFAFETGLPFTFSQVTLATTTPSAAKIDVFRQSVDGPLFIAVVSGTNYQVFDTTGNEVYKYVQGITGQTGPSLTAIYLQCDLGDATVDLK